MIFVCISQRIRSANYKECPEAVKLRLVDNEFRTRNFLGLFPNLTVIETANLSGDICVKLCENDLFSGNYSVNVTGKYMTHRNFINFWLF